MSAFYRVDLSTEAHDAVNMGTAENPIPGIAFDVKLVVHTMLSDKRIPQTFFIRGDGQVAMTSNN